MVLYNAFVLSWGLTITQNSIHTISDLDTVSSLSSAENDRIGADTDPEYRIDASLIIIKYAWNNKNTFYISILNTFYTIFTADNHVTGHVSSTFPGS